MEKDFVPIFYEWLDVTKDLSAEEKGKLIDALVFSYANNVDGFADLTRFKLNPKSLATFGNLIHKINGFYRLENGRPSGEYHWNWQGGKTPVNQRERSSKEYAEWRKAVFERDGFTCQLCGQVGGGLQAHHIQHWSTNVNERYQVQNGVTLCEKCHKELHKKGG